MLPDRSGVTGARACGPVLPLVTEAAPVGDALRTGRLQAQPRANVEELRGSHARVVEAGQRDRQRVERDLHDGAQQRLVALSRHLGVLQTRLGGDPEAEALLTEARGEITVADRLVITGRAVEKYVSSIFGKLGLPATGSESRRVLAVLLFLRT